MPKKATLTISDPKFMAAVSRHVANVERGIAKLDDPVKVAALAKETDALRQLAAQLQADTDTINRLQYAKMLSAARLGQLMPANNKGGRDINGNPKTNPYSAIGVSPNTIAGYRKLAKHSDQIAPYYHQVLEGDDEADERLTIAGFLRAVGAKVPSRVKQYGGNSEWYTPAEYVDAARKVMGGIDLDPASCAKAQKTVRARRYFTAKDNGLAKAWSGRVWLNPPYNRGLITQFVGKFRDEFARGKITQAIILTNNTTDTQWWHDLAAVAKLICFTRGRIKFEGAENNNTNGQTFLYYGGKNQNHKLFYQLFGEFGMVFPPLID